MAAMFHFCQNIQPIMWTEKTTKIMHIYFGDYLGLLEPLIKTLFTLFKNENSNIICIWRSTQDHVSL